MNTADIEEVLAASEPEDIATLVDIITDKGNGRLMLDGDICRALHIARTSDLASLPGKSSLIAKEVRLFGGNSIANLVRGGDGVPYREVVADVAKFLKVNFNDKASAADIEMQILFKILETSMEQMSQEEREELLKELGGGATTGIGAGSTAALQAAIKLGGFAPYRLALIIANAIARALTGKGLSLAANRAVTKYLSTFAGPIGWAITAIWTAVDLAAPAYRVTVPAVVMVAYMRQKVIFNSLPTCPSCSDPVQVGAKFCGSCGHSLGAKQ